MSLNEIRNKIPAMTCKPGCHDCCGPVPFSKEEQKRIGHLRAITSLTCPYLGETGCEIYEERPVMCRLFGVVEDLPCPHGCAPKVLMKPKEAREVLRSVYGDFTKKINKFAKAFTKLYFKNEAWDKFKKRKIEDINKEFNLTGNLKLKWGDLKETVRKNSKERFGKEFDRQWEGAGYD
jgi:Fe-S-cluster containining protein